MRFHPEEKSDTTSKHGNPMARFERVAEGTYHARLAASSEVSVVLFSAPQCGACRVWKKMLPAALSDQARAFYEVDVSEATGIAHYFGIFHLPTVYLYRDGHFHAELQCEARLKNILETALQLLSGPAQEEP